MRVHCCVLALLTIAFLDSGTCQAEPAQRIELSLISYNVHLLPDIALKIAGKRGASEYRAGAIGEKISGYDIIGLNEVFDQDHAERLLHRLQARNEQAFHVAKGPERSGRHLIGSGLLLASRFPIEETHTITYSQASRFVTSGFKADGFAAKGALHA